DVDLTDGSTNAERYIYSGTFSVGRFVPDHFAVTLNMPQFATGCAAGQFTYTGKAFDFAVAPVISVTAQNAANDTTTNYTGSLFRLTDTSLTGRSYADAAAPATAVLDTAGLPATTADPGIVDNGDGTSTLTFSTGTGLDYVHAAPVAPFNSLIDLSINVQDLDGVDVTSIDSAPATNPVVFNDIAFDNGNQMRYGRLFVGSAVGTELMNLPIPMTVQYYASTSDGFVTNAADDCTVLAASDIGLSNFQPYPGSLLATGDTAASINSFANGIFDLELAAPGAGKQGSVDVSVALSALMWLQFDWNGDNTYSEDPSSRAAFGIYSGNPRRVYQHEVVGP
ncbi:MAG TPA: DUF6701 domain-containing protein, partial [Gammaproteobacteria bacterium]|nr:DUF6701 domain-containing protein [Gammaproteobacteria bacterium]